MNTRIWFVVGMIAILVIANYLMMSGYTNYPSGPSRYDFEGFINYLENAAPTGNGYTPMGAYDGVRKVPDNGLSQWRGPAPNEPLLGPEVEVGPDNLFIFKNNQCKPECCGASFSCGSGCVCTTAKQRDFINKRGGNRTSPDDEA